jgi:hypothetical protein
MSSTLNRVIEIFEKCLIETLMIGNTWIFVMSWLARNI